VSIKAVEAIPVSVPTEQDYVSSLGVRGPSDFVVVRIESSEGMVGYGEASLEPLWPEGETQASVKFAVEKLFAGVLAGESIFNIEKISERMDRAIAGNHYAKAAVEMAIHDLVTRHLAVPLHQYIGGLFRDRVEMKFNLPYGPAEEIAELAAKAVKSGYRFLKLKVGIDSRHDLKNVEAARDAAGDSVKIGVDANGAWTAKQAVVNIRKMECHQLYFVEQPVPRWDMEGLATVRHMIDTPVMVDESLYTVHDAVELVRRSAADMFSIHVGKAGGVREALRVIDIGYGAGVGCTMGSNIELGIGNAVKLHIAASQKAVSIPSDIPVWFYKDDIITPRLEVSEGAITVPKGTGIGVDVDENKLTKYCVRSEC